MVRSEGGLHPDWRLAGRLCATLGIAGDRDWTLLRLAQTEPSRSEGVVEMPEAAAVDAARARVEKRIFAKTENIHSE